MPEIESRRVVSPAAQGGRRAAGILAAVWSKPDMSTEAPESRKTTENRDDAQPETTPRAAGATYRGP